MREDPVQEKSGGYQAHPEEQEEMWEKTGVDGNILKERKNILQFSFALGVFLWKNTAQICGRMALPSPLVCVARNSNLA